MKPVAVIILNWNGEKMLSRFLPSVIANTDGQIAEIIVADNGSSDNSIDYLSQNYPEIRLIKFDKNYGFADGYNRAIAQIENPYVVLLNSDVEPHEGWIRILYNFMEANKNVAACQPKILSYEHRDEFEYAGASGGYLDRNGYPYCRGRLFSTIEKDNGQYDNNSLIDWASGAALMIRREIFMEIGGLDPLFFAHMEEIDLCWRIRLTGKDIAVVPQAVVYHLGGGSLSSKDPQKTYLNFRNNLLMMYKNLPDDVKNRKLFKRRLLDTLAWGKYIVSLNFGHANAILRAHRHFAQMRKKYTGNLSPDKNLLDNRPNLISQYFIHRRRKFSQFPDAKS